MKRRNNLGYWAAMVAIVGLSALTYGGEQVSDFTTWGHVLTAFTAWLLNPFAVVTVLVNVFALYYDPTTPGIIKDKPTTIATDINIDREKLAAAIKSMATAAETITATQSVAQPAVTTSDTAPEEVTTNDDTGD